MDAVRWLKLKYRESPALFAHWKLVQPWSFITLVMRNRKSRASTMLSTGASTMLSTGASTMLSTGMKGDFHVRFTFDKTQGKCGKAGVKFPCLTRLVVMLKDDSATKKRKDKWTYKPTLQQNQKSCNPSHRPAQLQHICFFPKHWKSKPLRG